MGAFQSLTISKVPDPGPQEEFGGPKIPFWKLYVINVNTPSHHTFFHSVLVSIFFGSQPRLSSD